jgi:hypothetical protein
MHLCLHGASAYLNSSIDGVANTARGRRRYTVAEAALRREWYDASDTTPPRRVSVGGVGRMVSGYISRTTQNTLLEESSALRWRGCSERSPPCRFAKIARFKRLFETGEIPTIEGQPRGGRQ